MFKKVTAEVSENIEIASFIYRIVLKTPEADLEHFVPGQFVNLSVPGHAEMLLKRPFSICKADPDKSEITVIYQIKGKGTKALIELKAGKKIESILPVGRGFNIPGNVKNVFVVGGGVGIAPLLSVTAKWAGKRYEAFLGYRSKEHVYCLDEMRMACDRVFVTSDDGSIGDKGFVTETLKKRLTEFIPDLVLACGPLPMLKSLKNVMGEYDIPVQVSMEERMCCGFGACATCVCAVKEDDGIDYKKVCIEGPVFDMNEVVL